jgi:hypothetical protein
MNQPFVVELRSKVLKLYRRRLSNFLENLSVTSLSSFYLVISRFSRRPRYGRK